MVAPCSRSAWLHNTDFAGVCSPMGILGLYFLFSDRFLPSQKHGHVVRFLVVDRYMPFHPHTAYTSPLHRVGKPQPLYGGREKNQPSFSVTWNPILSQRRTVIYSRKKRRQRHHSPCSSQLGHPKHRDSEIPDATTTTEDYYSSTVEHTVTYSKPEHQVRY
jgi:hypothetical protein